MEKTETVPAAALGGLPPQAQAQAQLLQAAWEWVFELREEDIAQERLAQWLAWYEADARHKTAFDYMQALHEQTGRVTEEPLPLSPELWLGDAQAAPAQRAPRRRLAWAALAASVVAALCLAWLLPRGEGPGAAEAARVAGAEARAEAVRETLLPDGSRMELAAKTAVSVQLTPRQRTVVMQQGAAYFTVAHNTERPFIVKTGKFNIRAVGTAFNVRSAGRRVVVTVTEGTVDVYPSNSSASVRAKAGTEVAWTDQASGPLVSSVDPAHALAWQQGYLDYINEPLESVIADINRYSGRRVVVADAAAAEMPVSGAVRTRDVDGWVRALPVMLPVDLRVERDGTIVLSSRAS